MFKLQSFDFVNNMPNTGEKITCELHIACTDHAIGQQMLPLHFKMP